MKTYKHKIVGLLFLLSVSVQAQKFDKTVKEKFKVNSDVNLVINTVHTDVDIETWNRNEVSVVAVMEVEGVTEKEANKILKEWKFEALGNKKTVKISSSSNNFKFKYDYNFDFDFDFPDVEVHEIDVPDLSGLEGLSVLAELPEMPELPELFEMPEIEIDGIDFDYEAYKNDSTYLNSYKERIATQVEKFKNSDWKVKLDSVRNSDEYKLKMEKFKKATKKMALEMKELRNSKEFKHTLEESKKMAEKVKKEMLANKSEYKEQIKLAKEESKKVMAELKRLKEEGKLENGKNVFIRYSDDKNSKVKIKKYLKIKVPKNATFDLNVRHGKLNIPASNSKMSANISYGNFIGGVIDGENNLKFSNSPVVINTINSGNVTLKNVPNATFGTFNNSNLFANSSDVIIETVGNNVALSQKFGNLEVLNIVPTFNNFNVVLDYTKGTFKLSDSSFTFKIHEKNSSVLLDKALNDTNNSERDGVEMLQGFSKDKTSKNKLVLTAVYSTVKID